MPGHFSNACEYKVCFNCQNIGHCCLAPPCHFCEDGHVSRDCRYSWVSPVVHGKPTDESATVNVDNDDDDDSDVSDASFKTHSGDSFRWADESDLSNAYVDVIEELPLAAAISSDFQQSSPITTAGPSVTATSSAVPSTLAP